MFCKNGVKYVYVDRYIEQTSEEKTEETTEETVEETATEEGKTEGVKATGATTSKGYYHPETVAAEATKFDAEHGIVSIKDEDHTKKSSSEEVKVDDSQNHDTTFTKEVENASGIEASNDGAKAEDNKEEHKDEKPAIDPSKENVKEVTSNEEAPKTEESKKPEVANDKKLDEMVEKSTSQASGNIETKELEIEEKAPANTQAEKPEKTEKTLSAHQVGNAYVGGQLQIKIESNSHKDVTVNGKTFSGSVYTDDCGDEATVKTYVIEDGTNTVVVNVAVNAIL